MVREEEYRHCYEHNTESHVWLIDKVICDYTLQVLEQVIGEAAGKKARVLGRREPSIARHLLGYGMGGFSVPLLQAFTIKGHALPTFMLTRQTRKEMQHLYCQSQTVYSCCLKWFTCS